MVIKIVGIIISLLICSCTINKTPGELAVVNYSSFDKENLPSPAAEKKSIQLANEIADKIKRGTEITYKVESITFDTLSKSKFLHKQINTDILSYKEISFIDLHESINLLIPEYKEKKELTNTQALNLFREHLDKYSECQDIILFNVGQSSFYGEETASDVFSVMERYDQKNHNILLIEIKGEKKTKFWVHYKNLFDVSMTRRNFAFCTSGWLKITKIHHKKVLYSANK